MPSAKEMRDELRALRRATQKPISKMKKSDVSAEIERLKKAREETPLPASTAGTSAKKTAELKPKLTAEYRREFEDVKSGNKVMAKADKKEAKVAKAKIASVDAPKKKDSKMERLMAMIDEMTSDEE